MRFEIETAKLILNPCTISDAGKQILMTWDHIYPRCLGGSDMTENSALCSQECNNTKGQTVDDTVIAHILKYPAAVTPTRVHKAIIQCKAKIKFLGSCLNSVVLTMFQVFGN